MLQQNYTNRISLKTLISY